jgi:hypothetical protein
MIKKKEKLPLLIYPTELKTKFCGQNNQNPNEFTFLIMDHSSIGLPKDMVLDDAFPIIGEGTTEPNDNFITQLVDNEEAINAVDALGYINRKKVAMEDIRMGFYVANLLTHSNFLRVELPVVAPITERLPFGFQSEQRNYWRYLKFTIPCLHL